MFIEMCIPLTTANVSTGSLASAQTFFVNALIRGLSMSVAFYVAI